ncbi:response regulator [Vibrio parahaemolyticus]|uniref:response regulator n=1 Tax=Vibrio parahaemolyticus TaxID=670 RepID=UPI00186A0E45|nr:response regulator [Vibrio parahaemolyticus]MBE4493822.1 response regulator [Vibrio parahaemolyticus]MBE4502510.1 response regulator [Vibrio parahaemolyticus]MBE4505252.1 response regulator [Vibrio parahaemolyticus]HBC3858627.1 response regulator [Vibrio parahaemolyticus]HBC3859511.1 response regulator [Vibrio parahaemolyticus]
MIKVLIVDDNKKRLEKLIAKLEQLDNQQYLKIDQAKSSSKAKQLMRVTKYDLLVLDVVLPKRDRETPSANEGIKTLRDIHVKPDFYTPTKIIGITAFIKDMGKFSNEFYERTSVILQAESHSSSWISQIASNVDSLIKTLVSEAQSQSNVTLISIHGIRTIGHWQNTLNDLVKENSRKIEPKPVKYGFFSLLSFLFPHLRDYVAKKVVKKIHSALDSSNQDRVILVAHSFGTYIAAKAIESYTGKTQIDLTIFAGSVLKTDHDLDSIFNRTNMFINECGARDKILMICNMLVLGLGDAGRSGFSSHQHNSFINRYYNGGHDVYLAKEKMLENWVPSIISGQKPRDIDERPNLWYQDISEFIIQLFSATKPLLYLLIGYAIYTGLR